MVGGLYARIKADTSDFDRGMAKVRGELATTGGKFQRFGAIAAKTSAVGLGALVFGIAKSAQAAERAQVSHDNLVNAVTKAGLSYDKFSGQIDNVIQSQSRLSAFDDEDLQDSFSNLVRRTGNVNSALKLNAAAADIARARHIDLNTAATALGKAWDGQTAGLGRLGVKVDAGASKMEVLRAVNERYAGAAKAYGDTAAGAQDKFRVALENLGEVIGARVLPAITILLTKLTGILTTLTANSSVVVAVGGALGALAVTVLAVSAATKVWRAAVAVATAAQWAWNVAMSANPIGLIIVGLAALGVALLVAYKRSETFRAICLAALNAVRAAVDFLRAHWMAFVAVIPVIGPMIVLVIAKFNTLKAIGASVFGALRTAAGWVVSAVNAIASAANSAASAVRSIGSAISSLPSLPSIPGGSILDHIPGHATGGTINPGSWSRVNERGAEFIRAGSTPLHVTPAGRWGGGGGVTVVVNVENLYGNDDAMVDQLARRIAPRIPRYS